MLSEAERAFLIELRTKYVSHLGYDYQKVLKSRIKKKVKFCNYDIPKSLLR